MKPNAEYFMWTLFWANTLRLPLLDHPNFAIIQINNLIHLFLSIPRPETKQIFILAHFTKFLYTFMAIFSTF